MGINVHMESAQTPYGNYPFINRSLRALGMRHFRDEINDTRPAFVAEINAIGKLGYSLCGLIEGGNDYPPRGTKLKSGAVVPMIEHLLPALEAIEGPDEPDHRSFRYDGVHYPQGAINESRDLWNIVKGNPRIRTLPVVVMSEASAPDFKRLAAITPPPIHYANFGNMHAYQGGDVGDGRGETSLSHWYIPYSRKLSATDALWTTEMGYHNNTRYLSNGEQQGVSERASAIYLPIAFLSGFNRGVVETFAYELVDEFDPCRFTGSGEGHYGLLNYYGTPKPAFGTLKNLIAILGEPGGKQFEPGWLDATFSSAPLTMGYTLLQKSTGDYDLALWNDVRVYQIATDRKPGKDLYPRLIPITIAFPQAQDVIVYAPNDPTGVNPTKAYTIATTSRSITLNLPPKVLLLKIHPPGDLANGIE